MTAPTFAIVTATTETIRGILRVRVNAAYTDALSTAGLVPVVLPPMDPARACAALGDRAGLVLTGGEDLDPAHFGEAPHPSTGDFHARRDAYELALATFARDHRIPTLAICRGAQVMNVALGGTLVQDIPSQRPGSMVHDPEGRRAERVHGVEIESSSRLAQIVGTTSIASNSSHHQAVARVAPGLRVVAKSEDGIVEAIEPTDSRWWMIGVQWHPEELMQTVEEWDRRLFDAFARGVCERGRD